MLGDPCDHTKGYLISVKLGERVLIQVKIVGKEWNKYFDFSSHFINHLLVNKSQLVGTKKIKLNLFSLTYTMLKLVNICLT